LGTQLAVVDEVDYEQIHYTVSLQVTPHRPLIMARKLKVVVEWNQHNRVVSITRESTSAGCGGEKPAGG